MQIFSTVPDELIEQFRALYANITQDPNKLCRELEEKGVEYLEPLTLTIETVIKYDKPDLVLIFLRCLTAIVKIISTPLTRQYAIMFSKSLLTRHRKAINRWFYMSEGINLVAEMCMLGPNVVKDVLGTVDISDAKVKKIVESRGDKTRRSVLEWISAMLENGSESQVSEIVSTKDFLSVYFKNLGVDSFENVRRWIDLLNRCVLDNVKISKNAKLGVFTLKALSQTADIFRNEKSEMELKEIVFEWLKKICCEPGQGVCFKDEGWSKTRVKNKLLMDLINEKLNPLESKYEFMLTLEILKVCPELVCGYFSKKYVNLECKDEESWIARMALAIKIVQQPIPEQLTDNINVLIDNVCPSGMNKNVLTKLLQTENETIRHFTLALVSACCKRFEDILNKLLGEDWREKREDLKIMFRKRLADFQVFVSIFPKVKQEENDLNSIKFILEIFLFFEKNYPHVILDNRFDFSKLIPNNLKSLKEEEKENYFEIMKRVNDISWFSGEETIFLQLIEMERRDLVYHCISCSGLIENEVSAILVYNLPLKQTQVFKFLNNVLLTVTTKSKPFFETFIEQGLRLMKSEKMKENEKKNIEIFFVKILAISRWSGFEIESILKIVLEKLKIEQIPDYADLKNESKILNDYFEKNDLFYLIKNKNFDLVFERLKFVEKEMFKTISTLLIEEYKQNGLKIIRDCLNLLNFKDNERLLNICLEKGHDSKEVLDLVLLTNKYSLVKDYVVQVKDDELTWVVRNEFSFEQLENILQSKFYLLKISFERNLENLILLKDSLKFYPKETENFILSSCLCIEKLASSVNEDCITFLPFSLIALFSKFNLKFSLNSIFSNSFLDEILSCSESTLNINPEFTIDILCHAKKEHFKLLLNQLIHLDLKYIKSFIGKYKHSKKLVNQFRTSENSKLFSLFLETEIFGNFKIKSDEFSEYISKALKQFHLYSNIDKCLIEYPEYFTFSICVQIMPSTLEMDSSERISLLLNVVKLHPSLLNFDVLSIAANKYSWTCNEKDILLKELMTFAETKLNIEIGHILYKSFNEILDFVDSSLIFQTIHHDKGYDCQSLLLLISHSLKDQTDLNVFAFLKSGLLALIIYSLCNQDLLTRQLAIGLLNILYSYLNQSRKTNYPLKERIRIAFFINFLLSSITSIDESLPCVCAIFLAESSLLLLKPDHPVYPIICRFLSKTPSIEFDDLPLFYSSIYSSKDSFNEERSWMFKILSNGIKDEKSFEIVRKRHCFDILQNFYSILNDSNQKSLIIQIIYNCVNSHKIPNISCWVYFTIIKELRKKRFTLAFKLVQFLDKINDKVTMLQVKGFIEQSSHNVNEMAQIFDIINKY
ncbi:hypothetical protein ROZALSC1DRAFT_28770 [Rozella allomycis CSF55]|uniref:Nucleolar pre-ribosomal-associated protein 1 domain-containing protein n=1 Tax=Rozella allomycis (strain CSF55) TaxID=988480 RepID=A0A075ANK3_ROZAC|nr:Nucleolar pre-ribosomal-associated protein 1 domain-containing protein [Rozella allomycis CSF55]RKP19654.1 hypothetical protein ROZALSC1DRAFT_28770 [Rozella allomycis CSF55]|eukprot:EPZ31419.1 Nucleolar pre-ribosomal-associated protein 1 domain-containing protein [Rozella allomycis CSF55]